MIREFKTVTEALEVVRSIVDKYQKDIPIHTSGKSVVGLTKLVSFIILAQPQEDDNTDLKDELILLRSEGYPIKEVEWQPRFADQMDMLLEMISVTVEIKIYMK